MRSNRRHSFCRLISLALTLFLLLSALAGCGSKAPETPAGSSTPAPSSAGAQTEPQPAASNGEGGKGEADGGAQPADDGLIHVGSVEELLEAIQPGASIILETGRYDLTDLLKNYGTDKARDEWNASHPYVQLTEVFDGLEVTVQDASYLFIQGASDDPADTEIVTEPRYASLFSFIRCPNLELACLTMGHTETGDCSGNVLDFEACQKVRLRSMDLYGCGVYGIGAYNGCGMVEVSHSTIRDCEYGPFEIYEGSGDFFFTDCTLTGSGWGGFFENNETSQLSFSGCSFGQQESNCWYFDESATFEDCEFMEPTEYPDYSFEPPVFDPDNMTQMTLDEDLLNDSIWYGYLMVFQGSGETVYFEDSWMPESVPLVSSLWLNADRSGTFEYDGEPTRFTWEFLDEFTVSLTAEDCNMYVTAYAGDPAEGSGYAYTVWLAMQKDNELYWFY